MISLHNVCAHDVCIIIMPMYDISILAYTTLLICYLYSIIEDFFLIYLFLFVFYINISIICGLCCWILHKLESTLSEAVVGSAQQFTFTKLLSKGYLSQYTVVIETA